MEEEIWVDIKGFEGLYKVSSLGRIKSSYSFKILKTDVMKNSSSRFNFRKNKQRINLRIEDLVVNAFVKPECVLYEIHHKDGNFHNNSCENIEIEDLDIEDENWKEVFIKGENTGYYVSDHGRLKSSLWGRERIMKLCRHHGYTCTNLTIHGGRNTVFLHRLVAIAFLGNPPEGQNDVNHKDYNRSNNKLENLEWCSRSENVLYGYKRETRKRCRGESNGHSKYKDSQVLEVKRLLKENIKPKEILRITGVSKNSIRRIKTGVTFSWLK